MGHFDKLPDFLLVMALSFSDGVPTDASLPPASVMPHTPAQVASEATSLSAPERADIRRPCCAPLWRKA